MALRKTWSNRIVTPIPSSVHPPDLIDFLHDHGNLITMSPIVTRYEKDATEASVDKIGYKVWENIDFIPGGLLRKEITFKCAFRNTEDGIISWINAPMGLTSQATYSVKAAEGGTWSLHEEIESSCHFLLKAFVEKTMVQTRKEMHGKILQQVEERKNKVSDKPPRL